MAFLTVEAENLQAHGLRGAPRATVAIGLAAVALLPLALSVGADEARGEHVTTSGAALPSARYGTSAVFVGRYALVFGGDDPVLDQIVRYDTSSESVQVVGAKLPTGRYATSAVWTGRYAYLFGGGTSAGTTSEIVRYDPIGDRADVTAAALPSARSGTAAVWDGRHAYVFGGVGASARFDEIVRYTPETGTIRVMDAKLPSARNGASAAFDGRYAYLFGGEESGGRKLAEIVRYDTLTDTIATVSAALPSPRTDTSAVWADGFAYVFGGTGTGSLLDEIVRYSPSDRAVTLAAERLPTARCCTSAVWSGADAFVFGGLGGGASIVRVAIGPGHSPPSAALAASPPVVAEIVAEDGGRTRSALAAAAARLEGVVAVLVERVEEGTERLDGRFDRVDHEISRANEAFEGAARSTPLTVALAPGAKPGEWFALVSPTTLLDGVTVVARAGDAVWHPHALGDGRFAFRALDVAASAEDRAFRVLATVGAHEGSAILVLPAGMGALPVPQSPQQGAVLERVLFEQSVPIPSVEAPLPQPPPLATAHGGYEAGEYWIEIALPGGVTLRQPITSAPGIPSFEESVAAPVPASAGPTPGGILRVRASYAWEPGAVACAIPGREACVSAPFGDPMWLAGPGSTAALFIEAEAVLDDGTRVAVPTLRVPIAGQVAGWGGSVAPS